MIHSRRRNVYCKAFILRSIMQCEGAENVPEDVLTSLLIQGWDIFIIR